MTRIIDIKMKKCWECHSGNLVRIASDYRGREMKQCGDCGEKYTDTEYGWYQEINREPA